MKVVTFYSYKGGVGRTLTLANIARRLANDFDKTVAVLDFDLEAPGLHFKFDNDFRPIKPQTGIVDYLYEYSKNGKIESEINPFCTTIPKIHEGAKPIHLIAAGNSATKEYWQKLSAIDWHELFYKPHSRGVDMILNLKKQIEEELKPDFLLIDSRTGITEILGVTVSLLADDCVILSVNNEENLAGSKQVIDSIRNSDNALVKIPNLHFALSRIPYSRDPDIRGKEIKLTERLEKKLGLPKVHVIHSDPDLEWQEELKIGPIAHDNQVPIGQDYLLLFESIVHPYLNDEDFEHFEKIKEIERLMVLADKTADRDEKIEIYSKILALDNKKISALESRANNFFRIKNYEKALQDFEKLGSKYYKNRIECLRKLERFQDALKLVDRLLKTAISNSDLFEIKYDLLEKSHADKTTIDQFFIEWETKEAKTSEFYNSRACWFLERNLLDEAMEDAKKAIGIDVKYALAYATLAEIQAAKGDDEGFFSNLELSFVFNLKTHITSSLNIPAHIYEKYKDNTRFKNLLKQYDVEAEFMELLDKKEDR
jgi:MinD-like ATPase involved in chromosome partitioning or flagellar assembly